MGNTSKGEKTSKQIINLKETEFSVRTGYSDDPLAKHILDEFLNEEKLLSSFHDFTSVADVIATAYQATNELSAFTNRFAHCKITHFNVKSSKDLFIWNVMVHLSKTDYVYFTCVGRYHYDCKSNSISKDDE